MLLLLRLQKLSGNPLFSQKKCYKIHQVLIDLLFADDTAVHVVTHTKHKLKTSLEGSPTHLPKSEIVEEIGYEKWQTSRLKNNTSAAVYVWSSLTVRNPLIFVHKLGCIKLTPQGRI